MGFTVYSRSCAPTSVPGSVGTEKRRYEARSGWSSTPSSAVGPAGVLGESPATVMPSEASSVCVLRCTTHGDSPEPSVTTSWGRSVGSDASREANTVPSVPVGLSRKLTVLRPWSADVTSHSAQALASTGPPLETKPCVSGRVWKVTVPSCHASLVVWTAGTVAVASVAYRRSFALATAPVSPVSSKRSTERYSGEPSTLRTEEPPKFCPGEGASRRVSATAAKVRVCVCVCASAVDPPPSNTPTPPTTHPTRPRQPAMSPPSLSTTRSR